MIGALTAILVTLGGAGGALLRGWTEDLAARTGCPSWIAIFAVNIVGCFAMGLLFVWIEASFRQSGSSRLMRHPRHHQLTRFTNLMGTDPTRTPTEINRSQPGLRLASGFFLTGFLGGFTTFSAYALDSLQLGLSGHWWWLGMNMVGTLLLGMASAAAGLEVGIRSLGLRNCQ